MSLRSFPLLLLLPGLLLAGCGTAAKIKKLNETEYGHYIALRPFMTDEQREYWLNLKTDAEMTAELEKI